MGDILEYALRSKGVNTIAAPGDYDNIVQDSAKCLRSNAIIIFWELLNVIDGLQYKIELFKETQIREISEKIKLEIELVLKNIEKIPLVLINRFSSIHSSSPLIRMTNLDRLADELNGYLEDRVPNNVKLIDIDRVVTQIGLEKSIDYSFFTPPRHYIL